MAKRNIFLAMGFDPEDAMIYAVRADLADAIAKALAGKTQGEIVEALGLRQSVVSQILNGKIENVSVERLMRAMVRAGIPGYAEWRTADSAHAGLLAATSATATVRGAFDLISGRLADAPPTSGAVSG